MKVEAFQNFLLRSAVTAMACDGSIDESEIQEIQEIANNEVYFLGFEMKEPFEGFLQEIKKHGKKAINDYLSDLDDHDLNERQELLLIEVLIRTIEADRTIEENEKKFLQMVKSRLKISEEEIILQFPDQMSYLIDFNNYGLQKEFSDEIHFDSEENS